MPTDSTCNCGGQMMEGFIPDFSYVATWVAVWMPGEPSLQKGWLEKFRTGFHGVHTDSSAVRMVEALRCDRCGLLQLYSRKPVPEGATLVTSLE
jgi:hypothetical protein